MNLVILRQRASSSPRICDAFHPLIYFDCGRLSRRRCNKCTRSQNAKTTRFWVDFLISRQTLWRVRVFFKFLFWTCLVRDNATTIAICLRSIFNKITVDCTATTNQGLKCWPASTRWDLTVRGPSNETRQKLFRAKPLTYCKTNIFYQQTKYLWRDKLYFINFFFFINFYTIDEIIFSRHK